MYFHMYSFTRKRVDSAHRRVIALLCWSTHTLFSLFMLKWTLAQATYKLISRQMRCSCQIRHIMKSGVACICVYYRDVSDFLWGIFYTLGRLLNNWSVLTMRHPFRFVRSGRKINILTWFWCYADGT